MYTDESQKATQWLRAVAPEGFINIVTATANFERIETRTFVDEEAMRAYINDEHAKRRGVYWQPNECDDREYPHARPGKADVTRIRVLHLDLDFKDFFGENREVAQHDKDELYRRVKAGKGLGPNGEDVPPTHVVFSGGGFHAYWVLRESLEPTPEIVARVEAINANIAGTFRAGSGTKDISRLLRVAYTTNFVNDKKRKAGRTDAAVTAVIDNPEARYTLDEFSLAADAKLPLANKPEHKIGAAVTVSDLTELGLSIDRDHDTIALIVWSPPSHDPNSIWGGHQGRGFEQPPELYDDERQYLFDESERSERVLSVVSRLAKRKVPVEMICGVLLNPDFGVSAHVLDQKDPVHYAERQCRKIEPAEIVHEPSLVSLTPIPDDLPPMPSLVQGLLIDGAVTVLGGRGGVGKSLLQIHIGVGVALGLPTLHWPAPREPRRVLMLNSEDDTREKQHRLWAVCKQMGLDPVDLTDKLFTMTQTRIELFQATFDKDGKRQIETTPFYDRLKKLIADECIGLLIVDPMAELHVGLDENSNMEMKEVMIGLRVMAQQMGIPVMIAHHTRKGYAADGQEQDAFRGAGAIINAARVAVLMEALKKEEAANIIGKNEKREDFVVVSDAKQNYFAKDAARMVKFVTHQHPTAGTRAALVKAEIEELPPDTPPEALPEREAILDLLRERRDTGNRPYYTNAKAKRDGRLDAAIMEVVGLSKNATATAIKVLERAGIIVRTQWKNDSRESVEVWRLGNEDVGFEFEDYPM